MCNNGSPVATKAAATLDRQLNAQPWFVMLSHLFTNFHLFITQAGSQIILSSSGIIINLSNLPVE
jgi:hypothetical protein